MTQADTYVVYTKDDIWTPEDQGTIDDNSQEWKSFVKFMDEFYNEKLPFSFKEKNTSTKTVWNSSVENVLNRQKETFGTMSEDIRAIPGGRYGTAQFIRTCGPETLKGLSIGRLSLYVQDLINKNLIKYERTLLVKNYPESLPKALKAFEIKKESQEHQTGKKAKLIKKIKDVIMDILGNHSEGLSLAQIPLLLKKKIGYPINFQELGFPKLKNFMQTLMTDQVKIESSGSNHSYAILLENEKKKSTGKIQTVQQPIQPEKFLQEKLGSNVFIPRQQFESKSPQGLVIKKPNANSDSSENLQTDLVNTTPTLTKKPSLSLEETLNLVLTTIETILKENLAGLTIQKLSSALTMKLNISIDVSKFNCRNFQEFLTTHASHLVDLQVEGNIIRVYSKFNRFNQTPLVFPTEKKYQSPVNMNMNAHAFPINGNCKSNEPTLKTPPGLGFEPNWPGFVNQVPFFMNQADTKAKSELNFDNIGKAKNSRFSFFEDSSDDKYFNNQSISDASTAFTSKFETSVNSGFDSRFIEDLLEDGENESVKDFNPFSKRMTGFSQNAYGNGLRIDTSPEQYTMKRSYGYASIPKNSGKL